MNRFHTMSRTAIVLVATLGASTPTLADVCNQVIFSFHNVSEDMIRVTRVRYRDLDSGNPNTDRTENVRNMICLSESTCNTQEDDLGSVFEPRENHALTDIQFEFERSDGDGGWEDQDWDADKHVPYVKKCYDNRVYGPYDID